MRRRDGSIVSSNIPSKNRLQANSTEIDYGTYRCMIVKLFYTDDELNLTFHNKQVTYNCMILGGRREGQIIENCKLANHLGGQYNYHERVLRATDFQFFGDNSKPLAEHTGDIVYVTFLGKMSNPIIIGLGTQPLDLDSTGATKDDGHRWIEEYNGINKLINKDGEFELTRKGGKWDPDKEFFTPAKSDFEAKLKFSDNIIYLGDPDNNIEIKKKEKKITILAGSSKIDVDGASGVITIESDSGNIITIDKSGELLIKSSTKVNIDAPSVDVGNAAALAVTLFENLKTEFAMHTHNAPQAPSGVIPTSPPLTPLIDVIGSQTVKSKE